ncbi:MAG: alpha-L-rhamnosidase C-terminal domain-containing protein [bacterium]
MSITRWMMVGVSILSVNASWALTPHDLMCDLLAKPGWVPVPDARPQFSWCFKDGEQGDLQTAYQIQVATSTSCFRAETPDLWDSGKVMSGESLFVTYGGKPLPANAPVCWRVKVWDRGGRAGAWSQSVSFLTAVELGTNTVIRYPLKQTTVKPLSITTNKEGRVFVDFGKAAFGWLELIPQSRERYAGPFTLHLGEKAKENMVDREPGGTIRYAKVTGAITQPAVYRVPLMQDKRNTNKSAGAVLLPPDIGVIMPFRYVEVEESPFPITKESLHQIAITYPFDDSSSAFVSSARNLDRVYSFCKYSIKATTFAGLYIDGDRERIPYEADAYINQLCHYGLDREFTLARYSHEYLMKYPTWPTEWKQHSVMMAWADWMYTGNTQSLVRCYEQLKGEKLLLSCARTEDGLLVTSPEKKADKPGIRDIVDWPTSERDGFEFKPVNAVINAFFFLNLNQMADIAGTLGKTNDSVAFRGLAKHVMREYNRILYDAKKGCYVDGEGATHASLHANMLPLAFGMVPESERERVADFVKSRGMACSVYGSQYLLEALFEAGREVDAIALMTSESDRGWMNMMREGSTISMEAWGAKYKKNLDWNHPWGATPANIIPRYVLGVRPLTPGFGKVLIRPQTALLEVQGVVPTIRGSVVVGVRQKPDAFYKLAIDIPVNMTARLELPPLPVRDGELTLNGKHMPAVFKDGRLIFDDVESGKHTVVWQAR